MPNIQFSTGVVAYTLNDCVTVQLNPTDPTFMERLYKTFESLDEKQESVQKELQSGNTSAENFEIARRMDGEMRAMIDDAFEQPICEPLFGKMNVYALADGLPVWANLLLAVIDEIEQAMGKEQKQMNPRIAKYTAKYNKAKRK